MLYLFLGKDNFSKTARLRQLAESAKADIIRVADLNVAQLTEPTLLGGGQLFVLDNMIGQLDPEMHAPLLAGSPHTVVLWEDSLDKRKKTSIAWLKDEHVNVEEFAPPQGAGLQKWVMDQAKGLMIKLDKTTADYFLSVVMPPPSTNRFVEPVADLWHLHNELRKLSSYTASEPVTGDMVDAITTKNNETEAWDIINALGERNIKQAFLAMERFFDSDSSDDKAKSIQLNALLADQFRNILLAQDMASRRVPEAQILEQTGWKSGRLFIMKKLAGKFSAPQLISLLDKLERLDIELKSSTLPGQAVLQLITAHLGTAR
jgi:DNA polymerase III delta subunit